MSLDPAASPSGAIESSIDSLKAVYAVLLTLSLGEAFIQLVERREAEQGGDREIRWDRVLNLVPFLLLLIPFIHGMDRYFYDVYKTAARPPSYGGHLLTDCVAFTLEGSLFFVLARSLSLDKWQRFYSTIVVLLSLDAIWGLIVWLREPSATIKFWVWLDIVFVILIAAVTFVPSRRATKGSRYPEKGWWRSSLCLFLILVRTVLDYKYSWSFYFPS